MNYAVIMAGGSGTRLWPLSRQANPKQALRLVEERTMFQHSVDRIRAIFPLDHIFVVTGAEHVDILKNQVPDLADNHFIVEPEGRGTAPAIGLAALHLKSCNADATMVVLTADHYIKDVDQFHRALKAGVKIAAQGYLVTLGIKPESPATGFGYIQQGEGLGTVDGLYAFRVERFVEKPNREAAIQMLETGNYSWNSGMFIWKVSRILQEFARQMPEFFSQLEELAGVVNTPGFEEVLQRIWPQVKKQTIDYGVMEGAQQAAVIPVDMGWSDIGSWGSLFDVLEANQDGNIFIGAGPHIDIDSRNSLILGERRLIALLGVEDLFIIDTDDALLVCSRKSEQKMRELVSRLKEQGLDRWL